MFDMLRKMIFPIIIIVLVFFLGMIVLEWGLDFTGRQQAMAQNYAGMINGEEIPWQTWQNVYNNLYQNEAQSSDYDVPDDRVREIEQQAWQEVVGDRLLMQQAAKYNITVSDAEVFSYLQYSPPQYLRTAQAFLNEQGQFDYARYQSALADPQFAPLWNSIDPQIRSEITKLKLQQMVIQTAQVTDDEVRQAFIDKNDSVTVALLNAARTRFTSQLGAPTDAETEAYFNAHPDKYKVGERVVLEIVKADQTPSEFDLERAKSRAWAIYDSVKAGGDFAEFARVYSEDPVSGPQGGELGWFTKGRMVHEFDSAVWSLKEGEISTPVKSSFGWHVIKCNGYRTTEQDKPTGKGKEKVQEVSAQHILIEANASDETLEALWTRLENVRTAAEQTNLDTAAVAEGFEVFTTQPLAKGAMITYLNGAPEVTEWGLSAKEGQISEAMDLGDVFCLARVKQKLPAGVAEFASVKERVAQDVVRDKSMQVCRDTMTVVASAIKNGATLKAAGEKFGVPYEESLTFSRDTRVGSVQNDQMAIGAAFALTENGQVSEPIEYIGGAVIFELRSKKSSDLTRFTEVRDSVYNVLLQNKQRNAFTTWFSEVNDEADIVSNIGLGRRR